MVHPIFTEDIGFLTEFSYERCQAKPGKKLSQAKRFSQGYSPSDLS